MDPVLGPSLTPTTEAWLGSSLILTSCLGNILTPVLTARASPRQAMLLVQLVFTLHWAVVLVSRYVGGLPLLLAGRCLGGLGVGLLISILPSYVMDLSSPAWQGVTAVGPSIGIIAALLAAYVLGGCRLQCCIYS